MAAARRARQASRADAPRVTKRVARARDEQPRSRKIQVCNRCHGRAVRTRREELSMACYRHARTRRRNGVAGHMAQGRRLRAIAWVRATHRRCRSWNAAAPRALCPLCSHLPCMACGRTQGWLDVSACADHLRGRPRLFLRGRVELPRTFNAGSLSNERLRAPRAKGGWWGVTRGLPKMELPRPSLWLT